MVRNTDPAAANGEILPPERRDILEAQRQLLPLATPPQLLNHMGGFLERWSMRGKVAGASAIAQQFERLYSSYINLYNLMASLEHARIEHGRAINDLRHLDDILKEDNRRRKRAAEMAAVRDDLALELLQEQLATLRARRAAFDKAGTAQVENVEEVPPSPAEQLRKAAAQRRELRTTVDELIAQIRRDAGSNALSPELEEDVQRIKDDAEKLLMYAASER